MPLPLLVITTCMIGQVASGLVLELEGCVFGTWIYLFPIICELLCSLLSAIRGPAQLGAVASSRERFGRLKRPIGAPSSYGSSTDLMLLCFFPFFIKIFGRHLIIQVSKSDKFRPKLDLNHVGRV